MTVTYTQQSRIHTVPDVPLTTSMQSGSLNSYPISQTHWYELSWSTHTAFSWHCTPIQSLILIEQLSPVKPGKQVQLKPSIRSCHNKRKGYNCHQSSSSDACTLALCTQEVISFSNCWCLRHASYIQDGNVHWMGDTLTYYCIEAITIH